MLLCAQLRVGTDTQRCCFGEIGHLQGMLIVPGAFCMSARCSGVFGSQSSISVSEVVTLKALSMYGSNPIVSTSVKNPLPTQKSRSVTSSLSSRPVIR